MKLGEEVLHKISDLLVQIDKPKSPKKKLYRQKEYHIPEREHRENRLYEDYRAKMLKQNQREKKKMYQELGAMKPFKVQNKKSIFLNNQKDYVPIHERTDEILKQKEMTIELKRIQIQSQKRRKKLLEKEKEQEQEENDIYLPQKTHDKVEKKKLKEILTRLTNRENERIKKQNCEKLQNLKYHMKQNPGKPKINEKSNRIWEKRQLQRSLSANVFERFEKYDWDNKKKKEHLKQIQRQRTTPFQPKISEKSRKLAEKSLQRISLTKGLDRSLSCKCFSRKKMTSSTTNLKGNTFTPTKKKTKKYF